MLRSVRRSVAVAIASTSMCTLVSCGAESHSASTPEGPRGTSIEVADFEVNGDGVDRFASCPPPGELGQDWYPMVPDWTPPGSIADDAGAPPSTTEQRGRTPTERAIEDTRAPFR